MRYEEVAEHVFRVEIPLPDTPLRVTNAYLIRGVRGGERNLLIDTGFNHPECLDAMRRAREELEVDPAGTDLFITHMHADHSGLVRQFVRFAGERGRVFMSAVDGGAVANPRSPKIWEPMRGFIRHSGLLAIGFDDNVECHPGYTLAPDGGTAITTLADGQAILAGGRRLVAVETKGHTAGHMCLHDPDSGILFSGDHILGRITPNITLVAPDHDVLAEYLSSLDRVAGLDVSLVLPGHRQAIPDCRARIAELKEHHARRLQEVVDIVSGAGGRGGRANTVDVTREMRWSLSYHDWDMYPPAQKLFSAGEAFAHLHHLVCQNRLRMTEEGGVYYFQNP